MMSREPVNGLLATLRNLGPARLGAICLVLATNGSVFFRFF